MDNKVNETDDLYNRAKAHLDKNPILGKKSLAKLLGCNAHAAREQMERYRGERDGHSQDPEYQTILRLVQQHPDWTMLRISEAAHIKIHRTRMWLARYQGASDRVAQSIQSTKTSQVGEGIRKRRGWSTEEELAVVREVAATSYRGVAEARAVSLGKVYSTITKHREYYEAELAIGAAEPKEKPSPGELQDKIEATTRDLTYLGTHIRTIEDLLTFANIDKAVWEVARVVVNRWEVGAKGPDGNIVSSPLFQIKAWLRRKVFETHVTDVMRAMLTAYQEKAPIRPAKPYPSSEGGVLELAIFDHHYGRGCWAPEVGADYSLELSEELYMTGLEDLVHKASGFKIGRILVSVGNDFFNVDNANGTTTKGTPQSEYCSWKETFVRGRQLQVRAIERLLEIAPVHVIVVAGNHDSERCYYLGDALKCWFSKTANVTIDNSPTQRKYFHWGKNLIGFTHGNFEKHTDLPLILATEQPQAWANSIHREWHIGQWHVLRRKFFLPAEDQRGVTVRVLPSLCPADAWTRSMGFLAHRAAQAFFWDANAGCVAEFTHAA